ncbi:hypothetical protein [Actinomadura sp. 3N508]|uniref:hypothetical protein n=1 Tax=Actinomadura sp. 3N508 TaxID=3375153 RepID=UPI0037B0B16A
MPSALGRAPAGTAALLAFVVIAPDGPHAGGRSMDVAGASTSTIGVTAVVCALVQGAGVRMALARDADRRARGAVMFAVFIAVERRRADPLMPLRLFVNRELSVGMAVTFLYMGTSDGRHRGRPGPAGGRRQRGFGRAWGQVLRTATNGGLRRRY